MKCTIAAFWWPDFCQLALLRAIGCLLGLSSMLLIGGFVGSRVGC